MPSANVIAELLNNHLVVSFYHVQGVLLHMNFG